MAGETARTLRPEDEISHYRIVGPLGAGGMILLLALTLAGCGSNGTPFTPPAPIWTRTHGPFAAEVLGLASPGGSTVIARTPIGIMRSTDGGQNWALVYPDYYGLTGGPVVGSGGVCLVGAGQGVLRSNDGGQTWFWASTAGTGAPLAAASTLRFAPDGFVYAAAGAKVLRSPDQGGSWVDITGTLASTVQDLAWQAPGTLFAATAEGMSRTATSAILWEAANSGLMWGATQTAWAVADDGAGVLIASTTGGIHRSIDSGGQWTLQALPIPFCLLHTAFGTWFGGTYGAGIQVSADGGTTWNLSGTANLSVDALAELANGSVLAGVRGSGLRRTVNAGISWSQPLPGPETSTVEALAVTPLGGLIAGANPGGLFRSTDEGATWTPVGPAPGYSTGFIAAFAVDSTGPIYALDGGASGVLKSVNDGLTWTPQAPPSGMAGAQALVLGRGDTLYVGTANGVERSVDAATSFQPTALQGYTIRTLAVDSAGVVLAGGSFIGFMRSADGGGSWSAMGPAFEVVSVVVAPSQEIFAADINGHAWRSADQGATWQAIPGSLGNLPRLTLIRRNGTTTLFGVGGLGLAVLGGSGWAFVPEDMPAIRLLCVAGRTDGALYTGTQGYGVYRRAP